MLFRSLGIGSSLSGTAGAWAGANYYSATGATSVVGTSGATFYITGVQLEAGTTATPFEYRQYGTELALCQRYCYVYYRRGASSDSNLALPGAGSFYSANGVYTNFVFPVTMRTTPTLITPNRTNAYLYPANSSSYSSDTVSMGHTHPQGCFITSTTSTSATGGFATNSTMATGGWVSGDYLGFSAEL